MTALFVAQEASQAIPWNVPHNIKSQADNAAI